MKVLITGIEGFAGSHLAELLIRGDLEVHGIKYPGSPWNNISSFKDKLSVSELDINNHEKTTGLIRTLQPDVIYHLAALSKVGKAHENEELIYRTNINASENIFKTAASLENRPALLFTSTAYVYGHTEPDQQPITEETRVKPVEPYGKSKAEAEKHFFRYLEDDPDLNWKLARTFNHTGPRQDLGFVCADWAFQLAKIEAGMQEPEMMVGNLKTARDFSDVRDIVRAYVLMAESDGSGIFNVSSGKAIMIQKILDLLLSKIETEVRVKIDKKRLRKNDLPVIYGDNSKVKKATGWAPEIEFEKTLEDLITFWREKIKNEKA